MISLFIMTFYKSSGQITPEWVSTQTVNNPTLTDQNDMVTDAFGNVYVSGYVGDTSGYNETIVIKYNSSGVLQWTNIFDSTYYFNQINVDSQGNVFVAGTKYSNGSQIYLVKYDSSGTYAWDKLFNIGMYWNWGYDLVIDDSDNIIVGGITNATLFTTLKYDSGGNLIFSVLDSATYGISKTYLSLDENSNIYYTGRILDTTPKATVFKYNSAGIKMWQTVYSGNIAGGHAVSREIQYKDGYIYIVVATGLSGNDDYAVVKYDTTGNYHWDAIYTSGSSNNVPSGIDVDNFGNVYVTGVVNPGNGPSDAFLTVKFDSSGTQKWAKTYSLGGLNEDASNDIELDQTGNIYVTGQSSDLIGYKNFTTIKYDSLGNELWVARFHNTSNSNDKSNSVSIDPLGNIYVSGFSMDATTRSILTIKYSFVTGYNEIEDLSKQLIVYPNPFKDSFVVSSYLELNGATLELFDLASKSIITQNLKDGKNIISVGNLSEGMYIYVIKNKSGIVQNGKLIAQ